MCLHVKSMSSLTPVRPLLRCLMHLPFVIFKPSHCVVSFALCPFALTTSNICQPQPQPCTHLFPLAKSKP